MVNPKLIDSLLSCENKNLKLKANIRLKKTKIKTLGIGSFLIGEYVVTIKKEPYKSFDFKSLLKSNPKLKKYYTQKYRTKISIM